MVSQVLVYSVDSLQPRPSSASKSPGLPDVSTHLEDSGDLYPCQKTQSKLAKAPLNDIIVSPHTAGKDLNSCHSRHIPQLLLYHIDHMFSRISQFARHFSRPLPNYAHKSAAYPAVANSVSRALNMALRNADDRNNRMIHTAACLIIGDEVLGGKTVDTNSAYMAKWCFALGIVRT